MQTYAFPIVIRTDEADEGMQVQLIDIQFFFVILFFGRLFVEYLICVVTTLRHFRMMVIHVIRQRISFTIIKSTSCTIRRRGRSIDTQDDHVIQQDGQQRSTINMYPMFFDLQGVRNTSLMRDQNGRYHQEYITKFVQGAKDIRIPMEGTIDKRVEVIFRRVRYLRYLIRVSLPTNLAMTSNVSMSNPYLSTQPNEAIDVSLDDLATTCNTVLEIVIGCVRATSVKPRLLLRDTINIQRNCTTRNKITYRFNYFRGGFRVRRIICSSKAFPSPFNLPTITISVPTLSCSYYKTRTNTREAYDLNRSFYVTTITYRARNVSRATISSGSSVVVPNRIFNTFRDFNIASNEIRRNYIYHRFVRVPQSYQRGVHSTDLQRGDGGPYQARQRQQRYRRFHRILYYPIGRSTSILRFRIQPRTEGVLSSLIFRRRGLWDLVPAYVRVQWKFYFSISS